MQKRLRKTGASDFSHGLRKAVFLFCERHFRECLRYDDVPAKSRAQSADGNRYEAHRVTPFDAQ